MSEEVWTRDKAHALFAQPMMDLLHQAQSIHRRHFNQNQVQLSSLYSIKTGSCPEDCGYCSQSRHHKTNIQKESLVDLDKVLARAKAAKAQGASRFCMGAAWRSPKDHQLDKVIEMVKAVKALGLETCVTLGMLKKDQAHKLKEAGLDFYNHNLDTSENYYRSVVTTRTYQDRLNTIEHVKDAGIHVCCGGILGLGETQSDRLDFLVQLANMDPQPKSVPINQLMQVEGTPLGQQPHLDELDFIRYIALARIMMPQSHVRLSAGRTEMNKSMQTLCFYAGANSIFVGEVLLTTPNPKDNESHKLLTQLGMVGV